MYGNDYTFHNWSNKAQFIQIVSGIGQWNQSKGGMVLGDIVCPWNSAFPQKLE